MYRIGFTPWDRSRGEFDQLTRLLDEERAQRPDPPGRALDIGCGRGGHTVELAKRGWQAVGVDAVPRAIDQARSRSDADNVTFVVGDVTDLAASGVGGDFDLFLDIGCLHGLTDEQRVAAARAVDAAATPNATMLMLAFAPGRRGPLPRGVDREGIERAFTGWRVESSELASPLPARGPVKNAAPTFYRLRRE